MNPKSLLPILAAAAAGGIAVWAVMSLRNQPETMNPAADVTKIGVHALMPPHPESEDAWMKQRDREDHKRVEQSLFTQPSGLYTQTDIDLNGKRAPVDKFAGIASRHDFMPQAGDFVCPITQTKANASFPWYLNGKKYLFCCPPCIEEFVRMAKDEPDKIKSPDFYVQR